MALYGRNMQHYDNAYIFNILIILITFYTFNDHFMD
jgi:hypothetical protein